MESKIFDMITLEMPVEHIYSRLGYARGKTKITKVQEESLSRSILEAQGFLKLQGAASRLTVIAKDTEKVTLENNIVFKSISLARLLQDCDEVFFLGATAGMKIHEFIRNNSTVGDITKAIVFDAVASECVDKALDWMMEYFYAQLRRENKAFARFRFSAGYADFSLDNQRIFYDTLQLARFGVRLTATSIFVPEKTVTALVGVKKI
jgi:hypothetical protein